MKASLRMRALAVVMCMVTAYPVWTWAVIRAPELPNPGQVAYTKQQQIQLGDKAAAEVYQQMPVLPDSNPLTRYVNQLGHKLDSVIPPQYNWPYHFHVIPEKDVNAFALPGGNIFVNVGAITAADNEAELAGVLAHEMSHVYMQHSIKQMKQNQGPSILAGLGQVLGSMIGGVGGALASIGGQMIGGMWSMKYSRGDEAQADAVGAIIMYKAGYDPHYLALFFQKLEQKTGNGGPQFLSDHPNPGNRYEAISNEVKNWPPRHYVNNSQAFVQAKADAERTKVYTAQQIAQMAKTGQSSHTNAPVGGQQSPATMGNVATAQVMPNGQWQTFDDNGSYSMQYPANWQPIQDQQSGGVTIAPRAGATQGAIAYGVVIGFAQPQGASSLSDATNQIVQGMIQQNQGLRQASSIQNIRVNGVAGQAVDLSGISPIAQNGRQLPEHDWLITLPFDQNTFVYMVFVSPERDFGRLKPTFTQMLRTFHIEAQQQQY